jgi:hypothetical protein
MKSGELFWDQDGDWDEIHRWKQNRYEGQMNSKVRSNFAVKRVIAFPFRSLYVLHENCVRNVHKTRTHDFMLRVESCQRKNNGHNHQGNGEVIRQRITNWQSSKLRRRS